MSTHIADLLSAVKTKVESLDGIKAVYDYAINTTAGYPFATIREAGWDAVFSDTQRNKRTYRYNIYLFQEVSEGGFDEEKAARVLRELQDEVITAFDSDPTLGNAALLVQPVSGTAPDIVDRPANTLNVIVTIECIKFTTR